MSFLKGWIYGVGLFLLKRSRFPFERRWYKKNHEVEKLGKLSPGVRKEVYIERYYASKIALVYGVILMGSFLSLLLTQFPQSSGKLQNGTHLRRGEYGTGIDDVELLVRMEGEEEQPFHLQVQERTYTQEEIEQLLEEGKKQLEHLVLGENSSLNSISKKLNLIKKIPNTPIEVTWSTKPYGILDSTGNLLIQKIPKEGKEVQLEAKLKYSDQESGILIPIIIYPLTKSKGELTLEKIQDALFQSDEKTAQKEYLELPKEAEGKQLFWSEKKKNTGRTIFLLSIILATFLYIGQDYEIHQRLSKREQQMSLDYSDIVSKITLLLGAGMNMKHAISKITYDYKNRKEYRFIYEEMKVSLREMDHGVPEREAYERLGQRCGTTQYIKLMSILTQNLQKGSRGIISALEEEGIQALEERKNLARKLGEEAGTKLLIPMMMMLLIVLIILIVPAFLSMEI